MVHALASLCLELETPLVAEGSRTEAERNILVDLAQTSSRVTCSRNPAPRSPCPHLAEDAFPSVIAAPAGTRIDPRSGRSCSVALAKLPVASLTQRT